MREALKEALRAMRGGEVPIGAVVVAGGEVVGRGSNRPIASRDPTAHAEVIALRRAARRQGNYRLPGAELYVTLEPCLMCVGAMVHARIGRVVFAALDPKVGCLSGPRGLDRHHGLNHRFAVQGGVLGAQSAELLKRFFAEKRMARTPG